MPGMRTRRSRSARTPGSSRAIVGPPALVGGPAGPAGGRRRGPARRAGPAPGPAGLRTGPAADVARAVAEPAQQPDQRVLRALEAVPVLLRGRPDVVGDPRV